MEPYYDDGTCVIYHGDCREILPSLSVGGAVIADPPYGNGTAYASFTDDDATVRRLIADALPQMRRWPIVAITCGIGRMYQYPEPTWVLGWFAPGGTGSGPWGFTTWQPVLVYGPDPYMKRGLGRRPDAAILQFRRGTRTNRLIDHPCPKPLRTIRWLVERVAPVEGESIVDPFMGSGTTLVAAKMLGRRAIGIEIEEKYCEIAAKRLAQEVLPLGI